MVGGPARGRKHLSGQGTGAPRTVAPRGSGADRGAVEAVPTGAERRMSDDRVPGAEDEPNGVLEELRADRGRPVLRAVDSAGLARDSRSGAEERETDTRGRSGTVRSPVKREPRLGSMPASDRMAGATVARDTASTLHLRPAVDVGSRSGGGASSWTKLLGFLPGSPEVRQGPPRTLLQLHGSGVNATESGSGRGSTSGLAAGRDQGVEAGPTWAGGEAVSARAVLGDRSPADSQLRK